MSATFSVLKTEQQFTEENDSGRGASVIFGNFPGDARAPRTDIPEKISRAESQGQEEDSSGAPAKPDRLRDQTERFLEQAAPFLTRHQEQIIAAARAPYIIARGRKGGSNVAAAICNALLYQIRR